MLILIFHTATLRFSSISLLSFSDGWKTTPRVMDNLTMPLVYGQPKKGWCYMYRHPQHHHPVLFSPRDCMDRSCLTRGSRNFYWKNQRGGRGAIVNPKWPHQTGSGPARTHCGTWWCVQPPEVIDNINRGGEIYITRYGSFSSHPSSSSRLKKSGGGGGEYAPIWKWWTMLLLYSLSHVIVDFVAYHLVLFA